LLAAAGVIAMLPAVVVALVANKHIRGMLAGATA
jgi:ABC-type glycerol-3-phosphate transport system permease component